MLRLKPGESYRVLSWAYFIVLIGSLAAADLVLGQMEWGFLAFPLCMLFIAAMEWRSGVALDDSWKATHLRGTSAFRRTVTWRVVVPVLVAAIGFFAVHDFSEALPVARG